MALIYREVIKAVLMFELYSWVMSDMTMKAVEGIHLGLLRNIMGKRVMRQAYRAL